MTDRLLSLLPWAFTAGMFATVNPCGFAMLPAYLSYYVTGPAGHRSTRQGLLSGVGVGLTMTVGVLSIFLLAGSVVSALGTGTARFFPMINLAIGAAIVALGTVLLARPTVTLVSPVGNPVAVRPREGRHVRSFFVFGAGYGIASLGCTLPIFLVVMAQALAAGGFLPGLLIFVAYGMGMGSVLLALSVAVGTGRGALVGSLRRVGSYVKRLGALGMVAAGGYLIYYQVTVGRALLFGR